MDRDDIAQASNIPASEEGTSIEKTQAMLANMNVNSLVIEGDGKNIVASLNQNKSDRFLMFYTDKDGNNHAVSCFSRGNLMMHFICKNFSDLGEFCHFYESCLLFQ